MNNIPFLQTKFWAEFKGNHGWKPYYFTYQNGILNEDQEYCSVPAEGQIKFALLLRTFSLLKLKKLSIASSVGIIVLIIMGEKLQLRKYISLEKLQLRIIH